MKTTELHHLVCYSDGGCLGNGLPDAHAYGSYAVQAVDKDGVVTEVKHEHLDFPSLHTNNEAEYEALAKAVQYVATLFAKIHKRYPVTFKFDSGLIQGQLLGEFKVKSPNLMVVNAWVKDAMNSIGADYKRIPREEIVKVLGH